MIDGNRKTIPTKQREREERKRNFYREDMSDYIYLLEMAQKGVYQACCEVEDTGKTAKTVPRPTAASEET